MEALIRIVGCLIYGIYKICEAFTKYSVKKHKEKIERAEKEKETSRLTFYNSINNIYLGTITDWIDNNTTQEVTIGISNEILRNDKDTQQSEGEKKNNTITEMKKDIDKLPKLIEWSEPSELSNRSNDTIKYEENGRIYTDHVNNYVNNLNTKIAKIYQEYTNDNIKYVNNTAGYLLKIIRNPQNKNQPRMNYLFIQPNMISMLSSTYDDYIKYLKMVLESYIIVPESQRSQYAQQPQQQYAQPLLQYAQPQYAQPPKPISFDYDDTSKQFTVTYNNMNTQILTADAFKNFVNQIEIPNKTKIPKKIETIQQNNIYYHDNKSNMYHMTISSYLVKLNDSIKDKNSTQRGGGISSDLLIEQVINSNFSKMIGYIESCIQNSSIQDKSGPFGTIDWISYNANCKNNKLDKKETFNRYTGTLLPYMCTILYIGLINENAKEDVYIPHIREYVDKHTNQNIHNVSTFENFDKNLIEELVNFDHGSLPFNLPILAKNYSMIISNSKEFLINECNQKMKVIIQKDAVEIGRNLLYNNTEFKDLSMADKAEIVEKVDKLFQEKGIVETLRNLDDSSKEYINKLDEILRRALEND